jgi:hypothetical protein
MITQPVEQSPKINEDKICDTRIIYEDHLERGMAEGSQEEGSSGVADLNDAPYIIVFYLHY